jgi:hypothetical protein
VQHVFDLETLMFLESISNEGFMTFTSGSAYEGEVIGEHVDISVDMMAKKYWVGGLVARG